MPSPYTVNTAKHATVAVAGTDETVNFSGNVQSVEVMCRDGAAEIYFTIDGTTPTVGGDDTYVVPASAGAALRVGSPPGTDVVKLISSGTPAYSVTGYQAGN